MTTMSALIVIQKKRTRLGTGANGPTGIKYVVDMFYFKTEVVYR